MHTAYVLLDVLLNTEHFSVSGRLKPVGELDRNTGRGSSYNNSSSFESDTHTASRKTTWRSELLISKSVSTDPCLSIQTY